VRYFNKARNSVPIYLLISARVFPFSGFLFDMEEQQQQQQEVIDLTTPPRPPVFSRGGGGGGKEKEEEQEEDEQVAEEGTASKKDLRRVENNISHIKTTMERMFGVALSYPQNGARMSEKGDTIEWARGYGPTRLMEEIRFADGNAPKYGGFDLHKENDDESSKVKYVFKLPEGKDKVLCVPYYLMAEQVQKVKKDPLFSPRLFDTQIFLPFKKGRVLYQVSERAFPASSR
jgi:hypothetical protein